MPPPYLLHAAAVHFPIALLLAGWVMAAAGRLRPRASWPAPAASWLLWTGTAAAWTALALGLLAEKTAPHVPLAWEVLWLHERLGWATASTFTVVSAARLRWRGAWSGPLLALWLAACGLLVYTAGQGGELVFRFGMGVVAEGQ